PELVQRLRFAPALPTPPSTALRVIELANDPSANLMQIADCVALDPALAAKMLKVANSPLYNARRGVANVRQAVSLLGTRAAISVALSFSLVPGLRGASAEAARFWRRSVLAAHACRLLAQHCKLNPDDALPAGLLQDIGILAMDAVLGEPYRNIADAAVDQDALVEAERETFGAGHDEVGYWLLKRWNLPDQLALACLTSHVTPPAERDSPTIAACVAVSGYIADIFLNSGIAVSVLKAGNSARHWLGIEADAFGQLIEEMSASAESLEELFELDLIDHAQAAALAAEARELMLVANLGQHRELEEKARRDALTGAHNRSYFEDALAQEFGVASRHGWPLSLAFLDIDHFKRINDQYGHAVGDSALVALARLISAQIRTGDIFARYGGEEFLLLFPGTPVESATLVLQRIRETVERFEHPIGVDQTFRLTVSAGLACHTQGSTVYMSAAELLAAADQALYAAKRAGRNRIETAPPPR
ncbi:MAG TPA: GGDEF domain-containing protein, partial [Noviherbaspirillum sp.]|nr:GGDEF domain-containing protein [Noviherbaspirillum sp.]